VRASHAIVSNNFFEAINDDAIAVHSQDAETAPVQHAATITGNRIVDSQGICVLGAKHVAITGNTITRPQVRGILVGNLSADTTEGNTAVLSVTISGNVIDTVFQGSVFSGSSGGTCYYICVASRVPTTNGSGYVGDRDGSGGIVSPFTYFYTNDTDASAPVAGNWFVNITGNTCTRTLAATGAYSNYGYGTRYGRGGPTDPAITAANLGSGYAQIALLNHAQGVNVSGNICWGGGYALWADGASASAYLSWRDVLISGNQFGNFITAGIYIEGEGVVTIRGNAINGDPLHSHANRTANGKWDASYANCVAFWIAGGNAIIENNEIRNVGQVFTGASEADHRWFGNVLACNPSTVGYHADNIGIARVLAGSAYGATYLIEDGDPANATYGEVLNACVQASSAMPASGEYVIGHFVLNSAPSATTPLGWLRITTGSSHTLNTDWLAVGGPAFSSALVPTSSDGAALGTSALMWSDLFLASGAVINWDAGDILLTHSANALTLTGATTFAIAATVRPTANDGNALGAATVAWSDLFLASGAVINFDNGNATLTHSAGALAFAGATITANNSIKSSHATAGVGYATGAGGTVTQLTSKATGVTLDKATGQITTHNAALAAAAEVSFTVTNSAVAATDVVVLNIASGATAGAYNVQVDAVAAGSFRVSLGNMSAGSLSEALVLNFAVIKGVSS
jgi:hypothetical protein